MSYKPTAAIRILSSSNFRRTSGEHQACDELRFDARIKKPGTRVIQVIRCEPISVEFSRHRERAAQVAKAVANVYEAQGTQRNPSVQFDRHFIEANRLPEPAIHKAMTPKLGLLMGTPIVPITSFYENIYMIGAWLPQMAPQSDRPYSYSVTSVLDPAVDAVTNVVPALQLIERMVSISPARSSTLPDMGKAVIAIEMDRISFDRN